MIFSNRLGISGAYTLLLSWMNALGQEDFLHGAIPLAAGDTHLLDYGGWDGISGLTLYIDYGSDGSIDETIVLRNEADDSVIYLPIVLR